MVVGLKYMWINLLIFPWKKGFKLSDSDIKVYNLVKANNESIELSEFKCEKQYFADYLNLYTKRMTIKELEKYGYS